MHLQNIELRNYIVKNFMKEVPKIHHQENNNLKKTLISELGSEDESEDKKQENIVKSDDEENSIETNKTELLPEELSYVDQDEDEDEEIENKEVSEYKYLDDDVLSKEFIYEPEMNYQLHLCMYSINLNTVKPFLIYHMLKKDRYEFPKAFLDHSKFRNEELLENKEIKMKEETFSILGLFSRSNSKEANQENGEDVETDIQNIFEEQIAEYFNLVTQTKEENILSLYRGFLQEKNDIFLFFDVTEMNLPNLYTLELKQQYKFKNILVDEIINSRYIDKIPVESQLINIFIQHNELTQIKELNNEIVDLPIRGYICQEEEDVYLNKYYENKEEEVTLLNNKIYHKEFDYIYVFTDEPIIMDNLENIKSYALFVNKNVPIITESKEELDLIKQNPEDYEIFYFMYNTNKYYGVNSKAYFQEI